MAAKDSRIKFKCIHQKNGGFSSARDICKGEYILLVDSDVIISPNALEIELEYVLKAESDAVVTDCLISFSNDNLILQSSFVKRYKILDNIEALQDILCRSTRCEAYGHLFKSSLWENIRFPQGRIYEDLATTLYVISRANKVTILRQHIIIFQRPGSIIR